MSWCNRILFLPRNRHLLFYAKRALLRGHWPRFKKIDLDDGWRMPYFDDVQKMEQIYQPRFDFYFRKWIGYFIKKKFDYLVVDRNTNIEINAACKAARFFCIPVVYIMHGSDIFDLARERKRLVEDYDYLYLPNRLNADYFSQLREWGNGVVLKRFNRWIPDLKNLPSGIKNIMYVPMFNHDEEFVERSGCRLSNRKRYQYNKVFFYMFEEYSAHLNFYWGHNPKLDREPNMMIFKYFEDYTLIKWLKGSPTKYLKKMDLIITDVGSTVFFEALGAGKPTVCLYHSDSLPIKSKAKHYFGDCLQSFSHHNELREKLRVIFEDPLSYVPWNYIEEEINEPNDELVWEQ